MDRQYIRDHDVIERYLARTLTADEEAAFEEVYLGDAEILHELQAAERLRAGVQELDAARGLQRLRSRPRWLQAFASPHYAAAASVLLAVSVVFSTTLYRENQNLREGTLSTASMITRLVPLETVRGGGGAEIPAPPADEWTVLVVYPGDTEYDTYRAVLVRRDGDRWNEIWRRADLTPGLDGGISIGLPGRALRPGDYEARLEGRMADWPADRFDEISPTPLTVVQRN